VLPARCALGQQSAQSAECQTPPAACKHDKYRLFSSEHVHSNTQRQSKLSRAIMMCADNDCETPSSIYGPASLILPNAHTLWQ
jgi:hypothetical protein